MSELDTNSPSVRQLQSEIKNKTGVEIKLLTNDVFVGSIIWQDAHCLSLVDAKDQRFLISRQAIAYIKSVGSNKALQVV